MGEKPIAWVYETGRAGLTPAQMLVAVIYAFHAREDGTGACPTTATVADESRLSERSVQRARAALVTKGVLELEQDARGTLPAVYGFPTMRASATAGAPEVSISGGEDDAGKAAPAEGEREFVSQRQAARRYRVSAVTLRSRIRRGELPAYANPDDPRVQLIRAREIETLMKIRPAEASATRAEHPA